MTTQVYVFDRFRFDPAQGVLLRDGERISLPPKPFLILQLLLQKPGEVVSKATLIETLWPDAFVEDGNLNQCIFLLRKSVGKTEQGQEIIETLPRRGYRIAVPVEVNDIAEQITLAANPPEATPTTPPVLTSSARRTGRSPAIGWIAGACVLAITGALLALFMRDLWKQPTVLGFSRLTDDGAYKERLSALLSDGNRIYFSESVDAKSYLAEVSVDGGETVRHPTPNPMDTALAYSHVTNEILFGSLWEQATDRSFTALSLSRGSLRTLGDVGGHAASWSPDGKHIAYVRGLDLFVANGDGGQAHAIAHMKEAAYWPRWSPDGTRIRFSMQHWSQTVGLWEVDADGSHLHPLFEKEPWARLACCGDWTPDGRYYIFVVDEARRSGLWIVRDRRSPWQSARPQPLAEGPADFWRAPIVSPDGKKIFALGEHARGELVRYDAGTQRFLPYLGGLSTDTITFSRDRQWMAWTAFPEGTLWRSRIDGSERIRLTEPGTVARFPQWSPDGSQITYIAGGPDNLWKIMRVATNGSFRQALVSEESNQGVPTWSPDGSKLVFGQVAVFGVREDRLNLRLLDLKSGALSTIPGSDGLWRARWSPTGDHISAVTVDNHKLMLYDVQKAAWTQLTDVGVNDCVWSHDGEYIYFDSPSEPTIFRYHIRSHTLERYASLHGLRRTGFFGWSLNLGPDDAPLLLREAGVHEVYSLRVDLP
jgi:Tol biopolymer transport system component/DNA-binding winged helix-turn-helix (wHTH) protein